MFLFTDTIRSNHLEMHLEFQSELLTINMHLHLKCQSANNILKPLLALFTIKSQTAMFSWDCLNNAAATVTHNGLPSINVKIIKKVLNSKTLPVLVLRTILLLICYALEIWIVL